MKYNQPFDQPLSPNASYVDGNPGAGVQGSIPPAASIEFPQREIVAVINEANIPPSNTDLAQLLRAIRGGLLTTFADTSTAANTITVTPTTAHTALFKGLPLRIWPAFTNTSSTVVIAVGMLSGNLKKRDGSSPSAGDIIAGIPIDVVCDGAGNFRCLSALLSDTLPVGATFQYSRYVAGTYTVTITKAGWYRITAWGGGGGGGLGLLSGSAAGGGGGGGRAVWYQYLTPGTYTIIVGSGGTGGTNVAVATAGGTTSFNGTALASGGSPSPQVTTSNTAGPGGSPGNGLVTSSGYNTSGQVGSFGFNAASISGFGGSSPGAGYGAYASQQTGLPGGSPGGGGSGGLNGNGGNGADGGILIEG